MHLFTFEQPKMIRECKKSVKTAKSFPPFFVMQNQTMKQEGMTFDHDFCYFILLFTSLLKKEGREKENDVAKIVIKSHTFLFHQIRLEFYRGGM